MVSPHQSNTQSKNYASEAGRFLEADINPIPRIRGIKDHAVALEWHREAHKRDTNKEVKQAIAVKLQQLDD